MAGELQQTIDRIKGKAAILIQRYALVREQRDRERALVAELKKKVDEQQQIIEQLTVRLEYLTVVTSANPSREDAAKSRAILAGLVREIDKCISELSE